MIARVSKLLRMAQPSNEDGGLLFASGATVPADTTAGYRTGCIFQHTDGAAGTAFYINEGTVTSSAFAAVAALTAAQEAALTANGVLLSATAGTVAASKAVIVDANKDITAFRNVTATGTLTVPDINAGASGTAGSIDVWAGTADKGKLQFACQDQTGNTVVLVQASPMADSRTINIPDPLAGTTRFMLGLQASTPRTATADGTGDGTIADGGYWQFVTVTSDDPTKIVILPTPTPGTVVVLANGATGYELRSSAPGTVAINGGVGAAAESAIAASSMVIAVCTSATTWQAITIAGTTLAAVEAAA